MQLHKGERFLDPRLLKSSGLSLGSGGASGSSASWQSQSPPRRQRRASMYAPNSACDVFGAALSSSSPPSLLSSLGDFARHSVVLRPGTANSSASPLNTATRPGTARRNSVDAVVNSARLHATMLAPERPLVLALAGMAEHVAAQLQAHHQSTAGARTDTHTPATLHAQSLALLVSICQALLAKPFFPSSADSNAGGDEVPPHMAHWPSPMQPLVGCGIGNAGRGTADWRDGLWLCQHPALNLFSPRSGIWADAADTSPAHVARAAPYTLPSRLQTDMTLAHMLFAAWALHMRSGCAEAEMPCECSWAVVPTERLQHLAHRDTRCGVILSCYCPRTVLHTGSWACFRGASQCNKQFVPYSSFAH